MYTSPIEKIYGELQTQIVQEDEKMVMKAIREVGVNVDKETLIKALQYDRNQYTKGYEDGKNDVLDKIRAEIMQLDYDLDSVDYDYNDMTYTEEVHTIHREEVLQILDEHKAKSDEK